MGQTKGQGTLIRQARKELGWRLRDSVAGLQALASELGEKPDAISVNHFGKWERGRSAPSERNKARLCVLYEKTPEELGWSSLPALTKEIDTLNARRSKRTYTATRETQVSAAVSLVGSPVRTQSSQILEFIFQLSEREAMLELQRRIRIYSAELDTIPPLSQVQDATVLLRTAEKLSEIVRPQRELEEVIVNTNILLGWLNYNMYNRGYANAFWKEAFDRAVGCANSQLQAYVLGIRSCLYSGVPKRGGNQDDPSTPIALLDQALAISKGTANHALRAYLYGRRAEEHAVADDRSSSFQDLTAGHAVLGRPSSGDGGECTVPILDEWKDARLARYHGSAAQLLGDHREARRTLGVALETLRPSFLPQRAMLMVDIAAVHAQQENPDPVQAAVMLNEAFDIAQRAGLGEAEMRVVEARRYLSSWNDLFEVRQLDGRLRFL